MQLQVELNLDNDAFTPTPGFEVAEVLRWLADRAEFSPDNLVPGAMGYLTDSNGNMCGHWEVNRADEEDW